MANGQLEEQKKFLRNGINFTRVLENPAIQKKKGGGVAKPKIGVRNLLRGHCNYKWCRILSETLRDSEWPQEQEIRLTKTFGLANELALSARHNKC